MNTMLFQFLRELRDNNSREWFQSNKTRYEAVYKEFTGQVQQLIDRIATFDSEIGGLDAKSCIFRIYRDIRFSSDKTPYKTHLGAYLAGCGGRTSPYAGYYVHLEPDNSLLAGGVWCPPPALLKKLRQDIYDNMDEFLGILKNRDFHKVFPSLTGDTLKRMPAGFPVDCPHGEILKHKDFSIVSSRSDTFFCAEDWTKQAADIYKIMYPFNRFLNYTVREFLDRV